MAEKLSKKKEFRLSYVTSRKIEAGTLKEAIEALEETDENFERIVYVEE